MVSLIAVSIYCCLIKYKSKQKHSLHVTNNEWPGYNSIDKSNIFNIRKYLMI